MTEGAGHTFAPGAPLLRQGEAGSHVLVLTSGQVKVTRVEPDGQIILLAVRGPGEILGELAVLDGTVRSASVHALARCTTCLLPGPSFQRVITEFGADTIVTGHVVGRMREAESIRAELADVPAGQRLARVLARFVTELGPRLPLTQYEIASAALLSRSAIAAELAALRRTGTLSTGRGHLTVHDLAALRAAAE